MKMVKQIYKMKKPLYSTCSGTPITPVSVYLVPVAVHLIISYRWTSVYPNIILPCISITNEEIKL